MNSSNENKKQYYSLVSTSKAEHINKYEDLINLENYVEKNKKICMDIEMDKINMI